MRSRINIAFVKENKYEGRLTALTSKIKDKMGKKQVKKLTDLLITTPVNVTLTIQSFDCATFAAALKAYFEEFHSHYAIRNVMVANKLNTDKSTPLDTSEIARLVGKLHCKNEISTDKSVFQVFKYLTGALIDLARSSTGLTNADMAELFYPYVEMSDRFSRVLPSQSYLSHFLENYEPLFQANSCVSGAARPAAAAATTVEALTADEDETSEEAAETVVTTTKKSLKSYFKGRK